MVCKVMSTSLQRLGGPLIAQTINTRWVATGVLGTSGLNSTVPSMHAQVLRYSIYSRHQSTEVLKEDEANNKRHSSTNY